MSNQPQTSSAALLWAALAFPVIWLALITAGAYQEGMNLFEIFAAISSGLQRPFAIRLTDYSLLFVLAFLLLYGCGVAYYYSTAGKRRPGEEHGSALWGSARRINAKYRDKRPFSNVLLTQNVGLGLDGHKHRRNLNVLVVGGSGSGKTRFYAKPNLMQCNCSYIVADPKGEMLRSTGHLLEQQGYEVRVFDLINPELSDGYNPFSYIHDDKDAIKLVTNLIKNTTPKNAMNNDPFWEKAEIALDTALILYLLHEAPPEEQNFEMVMYMIENAAAREDDESYKSPLDLLFETLEEENPHHIALKQYRIFKQSSGKTAKSILISAAVRLAAFNLPQIARMTSYDTLDLGSLGERKRAVFALIPDNDSSFNYLVGMLYTQAFQELYYRADNQYGGRLPVHVRILMDEFANVAMPDEFERVLSTMRSREISVSIIIQNMAQLKALFKDSWENITGNCDTLLYLGGNEQSTHEYISKMLGKATIDTRTYGLTRGRSGSSSTNYQIAGRELLTLDEVRMLDNANGLLFIRGERAVMDKKYDLLRHPRIKQTADGGRDAYRHGQRIDYALPDLPQPIDDLSQVEIIDFSETEDEANYDEENR